MAVEEAENGVYKVTAVRFDPQKYCYVERGEALTTRIQPDLTAPPDPPATISATELQYDDNGTIKAKLFISWASVTDVNAYVLRYRVDGGAWSDEVEVFTTSYDLLDVSAGFYEIEVYSFNVFGVRSTTAATYSLNVEGVVVLPANVTGLTLTVLSLTQVQLSWTLTTAADVLTGGEVVLRHDPRPAPTGTWEDANPITINPVAGSETSAIVPRLSGTYFAKFQNQSGLRSETAASVPSTYANSSPVLTIQSWAEEDETPNPFPGPDTDLAYDSGSGGLLLNTASGEYKASRTLDLQDVYESLVIRRRIISDAIVLSGSPDPLDQVEARTFYRITQGSPLDPEAPHWEDWAEFAHQEIFTARAVEMKVEATSADAEVGQVITDLELELEFAQRTDTGDGTGFTTYTVTFDNPFYVAPTVSITVTDKRPTSFTLGTVTRFGFSIEFFGNGGAPAKRAFTWLATGYGKQIAESLDIDFPGRWDTVGVAWIREGIVEDLGASYVLTGYDVEITRQVPITLNTGALVLTGNTIEFDPAYYLSPSAGAFSLTGYNVSMGVT